MKLTRTLFAFAAGLAGLPALAHPGHAAPTLHIHDLDLASVALAAALLAVAIGFGIRAAAMHKRKSRP